MPPLFERLRRKKHAGPRCSMVVPAAGSSARMEGMDKILLPLGDVPILIRTLQALENCPLVQEIIVVTRQDLIVPAGQLCKDFALQKVRKLVVGGATRTQSVLAGVRETDPAADVIGVHDGARPFVTPEVLEQVILRAAECGAAAPAVPVHDTIKRAAGGLVEETLNREELFAVQTPQVFEPSLIKAALQKAAEEGATLTDDCAAVERLGMTVCLTRGSDENIKITTPADLNLGLGILNGRGELV
ncbi:2-C-methyl-D-erythritol 4-phosphate cytidylyltransferase [Eubacteriales bacterium SGI.150]